MEEGQPFPRPAFAPDFDFDRSPFTVAWEITRACALACRHCRAETIPYRNPNELSMEEGLDLVDQVADLGARVLVITGGDPLMREDVFGFIARGSERGLYVALSPSATGRAKRVAIEQAKEAGARSIHVSLDGPSPEAHDGFRGVRGSYKRTLEIMRWASELGMSLQVGTTVGRWNLEDLQDIAAVVEENGASIWSLFFLVPTGRGRREDTLSAEEHEETYRWLHRYSRTAGVRVRTIAGQPYRRLAAQEAGGMRPGENGRGMEALGVSDGKGFCFVSHTGEVCPSGFLQLSAGNVRRTPLAEHYRSSKLFRELRQPSLLKGKCGYCPFNRICGGSRARAYAMTGDYLAADPTCAYDPRETVPA